MTRKSQNALLMIFDKLMEDPTQFDAPAMFIHPTLVAAGITEADFPFTNPVTIDGRAVVENFPIPYASGDRERRYQWWTEDGQPAYFPKEFLWPEAVLLGMNGYNYVGISGFYFIVEDTGAWHGERLRDDEARDADKDAWAARIENPAGEKEE